MDLDLDGSGFGVSGAVVGGEGVGGGPGRGDLHAMNKSGPDWLGLRLKLH